MNRLRGLEAFMAVADAGSFAGAARAMKLSPPSVTRLINEHEAHLGVVLFVRTTRSVTLTDAGQRYLAQGRDILQELDNAEDTARGAHGAPKGHLRVTSATLFGQRYVSPLITEYLDQYPQTTAEGLYLDRVVNLVEEGIDVALRIGPMRDSNLVARQVGEVRAIVCAAPEYIAQYGKPESLEDLSQHRLLSLNLPNSRPQWRFAHKDLKIKPTLSLTSVPAALDVIKSGWGIGRFLTYQVGEELSAGQLVPLLEDFHPEAQPIHLLYGQGRQASGKVRAFVDLAVERLRANQYLNPD